MVIHLVSDNTKQALQGTLAKQQPLSSANDMQRVLHLAGLLQSSLEISTILEYFADTVKEYVAFDGLRFAYEPLNVKYEQGSHKQHKCTYRLSVNDEQLGQIEFNRLKAFSDEETRRLELLLGQLVYPLRNAIWYQRAIDASQHDPLTGASNRACFDSTLLREVELAQRKNMALSLIVFDIDRFKSINDHYGHAAGDTVLKTLVDCVRGSLRRSDMVFRYGGEEFVLLLSGTPLEGAKHVAERTRQTISNHKFFHGNAQIPVTASLGVASLTSGNTAESLFECANKALYKAKQNGRNRFYACHK